ncbi:hypothetical protein, partial [Bacillus sp. AFS014408]
PFSATYEAKTERINECRLLLILHGKDLDVEKLKWIYIGKKFSSLGENEMNHRIFFRKFKFINLYFL